MPDRWRWRGNQSIERDPTIPLLVDVDFFVVVMPYTLLDTDDLDREFSLARNAGLVIGDLFVSGILATGTMPDTRAMTMRHGRPRCSGSRRCAAAAALQLSLGHPSVASVIPAPRCRSKSIAMWLRSTTRARRTSGPN